MKQALSLATALVILAACAVSTNADEPDTKPITIPLKDIWALNMPGTRDIRELEPDRFGNATRGKSSDAQIQLQKESLIARITREFTDSQSTFSQQNGFVVRGNGLQALRNTAELVAEGKQSSEAITAGSDISLVFFTRLSGWYVHLEKVTKTSNEVYVSYKLIPHETKEMTTHLALIPLGKMATGEVSVKITRLQMEKKFLDAGFKPPDTAWEKKTISQSFRFEIAK